MNRYSGTVDIIISDENYKHLASWYTDDSDAIYTVHLDCIEADTKEEAINTAVSEDPRIVGFDSVWDSEVYKDDDND